MLLHSYWFTNNHVYFIIVESVAFLVASVAQQSLTCLVAKIRLSRAAFTFVFGQNLSSSSWISTRPFSKSAPFSDILHPLCAHIVNFYQLVLNSERQNDVTHIKRNNIRTCLKYNQLDALISQICFWNETLLVSDSSSVHHTSFSLYTQQCFMSYRFADSLRAASCQQTCTTYTIAACTGELSETSRFSFQK